MADHEALARSNRGFHARTRIGPLARAPVVKWVVSYGLNRITGFFSCRVLQRSISQFRRAIHRLHNVMYVNLGDARTMSRGAMWFLSADHSNNEMAQSQQNET